MPLLEINKATRNGKTLFDFVCYCINHPDERFWQALRNWSGYAYVMVGEHVGGIGAAGLVNKDYDTFYIEGARHDHKRPDTRG